MSDRGRHQVPTPERHVRYTWAASVLRGRVLDAGCGAGWGTALLADSAEETVGLDFSPPALAEARARYGSIADFRDGDLRALPFADREFDGAVCFETLVNVAEPAHALDELKRVLRPDGLLLVSAPDPQSYPPGNPLHLSELSRAELERLLRERFANVALHRQRACFASLLGESAEAIVGGSAGPSQHTVASAIDGELPPPPNRLALGEEIDYTGQRKQLERWQERAVHAEAEAECLRRELRARQS